jgi:hypothetical protein
MKKKNSDEPKDPIIEMLKEMYTNYGIDISNMSEDEFARLKAKYAQKPPGSLRADLEASKQYLPIFEEDII